jgi:hypothetical protein
MSVAEKIGQSTTQMVGKMGGVPVEPIVIQKATLLETPIIAEQQQTKAMETPSATPAQSTKKGKKRG